jgi:hypothetical protein
MRASVPDRLLAIADLDRTWEELDHGFGEDGENVVAIPG